MALALLGVRLLLAMVFVTAGITKLRDRRQFSQTLIDFGVAPPAVEAAAILIPLLELVVGLSFLKASYVWWGGLASITLLALFTAAAAFALLRGRSPDCACFGSGVSEPIGTATLIRNGALVVLALVVLVRGPGGEFTSTGTAWADSTSDERTLSVGALLFLVAAVALTLQAGRLRASNTRLASRIDALENQLRAQPGKQPLDLGAGGLPVGTLAPTFDLPRLDGDRASLASLTAGGRSVALIFLSAHCSACHELWPDIERWQSGGGQVEIAEICSGSAPAIEMKLMGHAPTNVLLEGDAHVAEAYSMSLKPSVVIVGPTGLIESESVAGVAAIRALVTQRIRPSQAIR